MGSQNQYKTICCIMFLTNVLLKKVKAKDILVCLESVVSGHKINLIRPRLGDKMEVLRFDPWIRMEYLQGKEEGAELIVNNCDFSVNKHEKFSLEKKKKKKKKKNLSKKKKKKKKKKK